MCTNHNQIVFSDFPPSNTVKFENVGPTFSNFGPFLFYLSEAKPVLNIFHDRYIAFQKGQATITRLSINSIAFIGFSSGTKSRWDCPFKYF